MVEAFQPRQRLFARLPGECLPDHSFADGFSLVGASICSLATETTKVLPAGLSLSGHRRLDGDDPVYPCVSPAGKSVHLFPILADRRMSKEGHCYLDTNDFKHDFRDRASARQTAENLAGTLRNTDPPCRSTTCPITLLAG